MMTRSFEFSKFYLIAGCLACLVSGPVFAATSTPSVDDTMPVIQALHDAGSQQQQENELIFDHLAKSVNRLVNAYKLTKQDVDTDTDSDHEGPTFLGDFVGIFNSRINDTFLTTQVGAQIATTTNGVFSGNDTVTNATADGSANPMADTYIASEASLQQRFFNSSFCVPESLNASPECKAKAGQATTSYENFIDFFTGSGTWTDQKILDVLLFARRFYGNTSDKVFLGQGVPDAGTFAVTMGGVAQSNMRMSILNDLAMRRAPTSQATGDALNILLRILLPSGDVPSLNYQAVCNGDTTKQTASVHYACAFTAPQGTTTKRLMSQAALDRIMQFDYMLSPNFYSNITSPEYSASGSIDKVEVYLKAQQLAQDYRALRLMQMKTAATAMNIINSGK